MLDEYACASALGCAALAFMLLRPPKFASSSDGYGGGGNHKRTEQTTQSFKRFQRTFLAIFYVMMAADWIQGAYVYRLYEHYGFSMAENGRLFVAGFASSMVFGLVAGPAIDKYGRRNGCLAYGVLYLGSCAVKHSSSFNVLLVGRVLGGAATSILFSAFEAWMVAQHTNQNFDPSLLASTFSRMYIGNGLVAIASGWLAQVAADWAQHPVAPFDVASVLLLLGSVGIATMWGENYGQRDNTMGSRLSEALTLIRRDTRVSLLGVAQALFEGAMFTFVFMWTPRLEVLVAQRAAEEEGVSGGGGGIPHGSVFAAFMVFASLGGALFEPLQGIMELEVLLQRVFCLAAASMAISAYSDNSLFTFASFLIFELCVGIFWPAMGALRARYVPEAARATVINVFRVPLNMIVCVLLYSVDLLSPATVFSFCAIVHCVCAALFTKLRSLPAVEATAPTTKPNALESLP